jgi:hypothetical protein
LVGIIVCAHTHTLNIGNVNARFTGRSQSWVLSGAHNLLPAAGHHPTTPTDAHNTTNPFHTQLRGFPTIPSLSLSFPPKSHSYCNPFPLPAGLVDLKISVRRDRIDLREPTAGRKIKKKGSILMRKLDRLRDGDMGWDIIIIVRPSLFFFCEREVIERWRKKCGEGGEGDDEGSARVVSPKARASVRSHQMRQI